MRTLHWTRATRRPPRGGRWLALLAAVVALHGWLIEQIGRRAPAAAAHDPAAPRAPALQTRVVVPPAAVAPAQVATESAPAPPSPAPRPVHGVLQREAPAVAPPVAQPVAQDAVEASLSATAAAPATRALPAAPPAAVAAEAPADGAGEPPPVYATRVPAPARLRYALSYHGQAGEATLSWQTDGQRYLLALDGRSSGPLQPGGRAGPALVEQVSRGGFDGAGLAPERFTDRRRGRPWQAANFRRESGRIGFSGPAVEYPAWPGAQDRLGWIAQLAAIADAATEPLRKVTVFVVDARGVGELWVFASLGAAPLATPLGTLDTLHLRREAPSAEALQVEVWLDPARGHWPAGLRLTAPRRNDVFELRLAAEPGPP